MNGSANLIGEETTDDKTVNPTPELNRSHLNQRDYKDLKKRVELKARLLSF